MDLLDHLTHEHREAEKLMDELSETEPGAHRDRLVVELTDALTKHMAVEERFLYPIVTEVLGKEPETEAEVEHDLGRDGLAKLHELRTKPGFGAAVDMLKAGIGHHVQEEENEMFPQLRRKAADEIASLDPETLEARVEADASTRDELYTQAQQADVAGRSTMSKDELATAVVDAS